MAPHPQIDNSASRLLIRMLLGGTLGPPGKVRAGSTSLEEGEKVSPEVTRHRKGERTRNVRGVG
jgi:hypothetical protein